jgi:hypothetical protein
LHRSAAELLRSHCWRYAVCGAPCGISEADPHGLFEVRVNEGLNQLRGIGWRDPRSGEPLPQVGGLITTPMRELRGKPFTVRQEVYVRDRVREQRGWYLGRSAESRRAAWWWQALASVSTAAAIAATAAKAFEWGGSVDLVGLASSAAAASVAWSELRQYQPLVAAHALVAQELSTMEITMDKVTTEQLWAAEVGAAEAAISPEHTAWLARHRR